VRVVVIPHHVTAFALYHRLQALSRGFAKKAESTRGGGNLYKLRAPFRRRSANSAQGFGGRSEQNVPFAQSLGGSVGNSISAACQPQREGIAH